MTRQLYSNAVPGASHSPPALAFLRAMFGEVPAGHLTVNTIATRKGAPCITYWPENVTDAAALAGKWAPTTNVYFGVGLRRERLDKWHRGENADVSLVPALYADLDVGTVGHAAEGHPATVDDALAIVADTGLTPGAVVGSGGGIHPYILLAEPVSAEIHAALNKRYHAALCAAAKARGYREPDNVSDSARILRLPGTLNHKTGTGRPVELLHFDDGQRYTVAELDAVLPALPVATPTPAPTPGASRPASTTVPADASTEVRRIIPYIDATAAAIARTPAGERGGELHKAAISLGSALAGHGCEHLLDAATAALRDAARLNGLEEYDGPAKVANNIARGIAKGRANPRTLPAKVYADTSSKADASQGDDAGADDSADADVVALARACIVSLPEMVAGMGRKRHTVAKLAHVILSRMAATGTAEIHMGVHTLAHRADTTPSTVWRARAELAEVGITCEPGGFDADGKARATVWRMALRQTAIPLVSGAVAGAQGTHCSLAQRVPGSALSRSTRRRVVIEGDEQRAPRRVLCDPPMPRASGKGYQTQVEDGALAGAGAGAWLYVAALQGADGPMTAAMVAEALSMPLRTVQRALAALAARGLLDVTQVRTAGRSANAYAWRSGPAVAREERYGARLIDAGEKRLADRKAEGDRARQWAAATGGSCIDYLEARRKSMREPTEQRADHADRDTIAARTRDAAEDLARQLDTFTAGWLDFAKVAQSKMVDEIQLDTEADGWPEWATWEAAEVAA